MSGGLEDALLAIQERNKKVEIEKAWETSPMRRGFIAVMTYITAYLYMALGLGVENAFLHAFVPTGGYMISTYGLPFVKNRWIVRKYGQNT